MQSDDEKLSNSAIHAAIPDSTDRLDIPDDDSENPDIEAILASTGSAKGRKSGPIPEKQRNSRLPRLAFGDLQKTRSTLSRLTKRYAAGRISEAEYRALVYGMRALSQMHVSERIGRVEAYQQKIETFFKKKGINL